MNEIEPKGYLSPVELMKLPRAEREKILFRAAEAAEEEYRTDSDLTDFEAFAEEEIHDDDEEGETEPETRRVPL